MYLSFQSINNNSTKFAMEIDKENTWKEKDEKNVHFFLREKSTTHIFQMISNLLAKILKN